MQAEITPLILTFNEAPNIERVLDELKWANQIVVLDSGSTDGTLELLKNHRNVKVFHRPFDDHKSQWNSGLEQITSPWVLSLDADYVLTQELVDEIRGMHFDVELAGYSAGFKYALYGRILRGTLYPNRVVLFRRDLCHYRQEGHTQILHTNGPIGRLRGKIVHDDRKPLARWLDAQRAYAKLEAEHLLKQEFWELSWPDRMRRWIWPAAPAAFIYALFLKGCFLDGWPGLSYVMQRTYAEVLLSLELLDRRWRNRETNNSIGQMASSSSQLASNNLNMQ